MKAIGTLVVLAVFAVIWTFQIKNILETRRLRHEIEQWSVKP